MMLLTEAQAAREVQVDRRTIRRLIRAGRLRAVDFGSGRRRCYRIDPADLHAVSPAGAAADGVTPAAAPAPPNPRGRRPGSPQAPVNAYLPSV